jgi:hypothetical protein
MLYELSDIDPATTNPERAQMQPPFGARLHDVVE